MTETAPGAAVAVRGVSRRFEVGAGEIWAVRGISLSVAPGELLALIGRSGSGKTTLLNMIGGLDRPTEGEVEFDGLRLDTLSEGALTRLRRTRIGFVFQSFGLLPLLSAQENVELPLRIAGYSHSERVRRARQVLDMVGLGRRSHHRPYELSGGEQQRVAIARAIATKPSLVLADEPTGELDSSTATIIFSLLRDLARGDGITVIICTHDRLVIDLAPRVEELADGQLVAHGEGAVGAHLRGRDWSAFAAHPEASGRLSSLIGADQRQFSSPATPASPSTQERQGSIAGKGTASHDAGPATEPVPSSPEEAAEPRDDSGRWGRPGSR